MILCRLEIEGEIRKHVDELMREELKNLKLVRLSKTQLLSEFISKKNACLCVCVCVMYFTGN